VFACLVYFPVPLASAHPVLLLCPGIVQAVVGEADLRLAEMKKLTYEFDRDIVRGAVNPVSQIPFLPCVTCRRSVNLCL